MDAVGKITDPDLLRFARTDAEPPRSVIIELDLAPLGLDVRPTGARPAAPPADYLTKSAKAGAGDAPSLDQLGRELTALGLTRDLLRLDTAQAFVVSATPAQVRAASRLPLVGGIRPNRTHHAPAPPRA